MTRINIYCIKTVHTETPYQMEFDPSEYYTDEHVYQLKAQIDANFSEPYNFNLLTNLEKNYLFKYHLNVYSNISKYLNSNEKKWLASFI